MRFRGEYGGCPDKALTEFGYFVSDMTGNGYTFGGDNGNIELYTIGLGALMQTEGGSDPDDPMSGSELLNGMLSAAYGQNVPANHYMTITDATGSSDSSAASKLDQDLRIVLGLNHTFSDLIIKDDLSKYVDLYGLADAGSSASAIMTAAKAKETMTVPDPAGEDAVIRSGKLTVGTYYLVETETPAGFNTLPGPVKIIVTEASDGTLSMTAEINGEYVGDDKLEKLGNGVWKLSVMNSSGVELPYTGGIGTTIFYVLGSILVLVGGVYLAARRRIMDR